jgi:hypothetical protein
MSTAKPKIMNPDLYDDEPDDAKILTASEQAQKWYQLAALCDGNKTQASLTKLYNDNSNIQWYLDAANGGDRYAQYALGKMYYIGVLTDVNLMKSAMWFSKASSSEISLADYELGKMCYSGIGMEIDTESAGQLFQRAFTAFVEQEQHAPNPNIELKLATIYENGLTGSVDLNLARYWRGMADNNKSDYIPEVPQEKPEPVVPVIPHPVKENPKKPELKILEAKPPERAKNPEIPVQVVKEPEISLPAAPHCQETRKVKQEIRRETKSKIKTSEKAKKTPAINDVELKEFLDMIMPSVLDFHDDYFICGNTFRSVWAIREYPTVTEQTALLKQLGEMDGITLRIYTRPVTPFEENKMLDRAERKNKHNKSNATKMRDEVAADSNLSDMRIIAARQHEAKESLIHCAVFIEMIATSYKNLNDLKQKMISFFARSKITYDNLWLMQREGFQSVMLTGSNQFKSQFERALPSGSVANLYPFSYSGKTDPDGLFIGRDVNGSNIIVNFDRRSQDKTNGHILILGNSGEGKSHLLKLINTNFRQMGKKLFILDPDDEYKDLTLNLKGCYLDMMSGQYFINVLEPRLWTIEPETDKNADVPEAFRRGTRLSQHIAYLRDWFRCYKGFSTEQLDTLEILLEKLYPRYNISDDTDFNTLRSEDYPIPSDLFKLAQYELDNYNENGNQLYTKDILRSLTLGLRSICVGNESIYFNGHTNITNADFIDFSVKGMLETNENLKNAMFMNIFSYMSHEFLTEGEADIAIDELHLFLSNRIAIDYIRSFIKRGRKKNSGVILASQNVEDFLLPEVIAYTKPLLSIPTHSFLFYPGGNCAVKDFQRALAVKECEYNLISEPNQGYCLYKCGSERYHLHVIAPDYKKVLFGTAGGR